MLFTACSYFIASSGLAFAARVTCHETVARLLNNRGDLAVKYIDKSPDALPDGRYLRGIDGY